MRPELHELISGNYDRTAPEKPELRRAHYAWFVHITGTLKSWRENHQVVEDELDGRPVRLLLTSASS